MESIGRRSQAGVELQLGPPSLSGIISLLPWVALLLGGVRIRSYDEC